MVGLTKERLIEIIYKAWNEGQSSIVIPVAIPGSPVDLAEIPISTNPTKYKSQYSTVEIKWQIVKSHFAMKTVCVFHTYLKGWLIKETQTSIASDYANHFEIPMGQLMLEVISHAVTDIIKTPELQPLLPYDPDKFYMGFDNEQATILELTDKLMGEAYTIPPISVDEDSIYNHVTSQFEKSAELIEKYKKQHQSAWDAMVSDVHDNLSNPSKAHQVSILQQLGHLQKEKAKGILQDNLPPFQQKPKGAGFKLKPKSEDWQGSKVQDRAVTRFPVLNTEVDCPVKLCLYESPLSYMIQHLNDTHKWKRTREEVKPGEPNIVDWLEEWSLATGNSLEIQDGNAGNGSNRETTSSVWD